MSRCFPYPPPGYSRNGATYEALIESIKLQKENDKAKTDRKKEKRAKKEKKEKKEKRKDSEKSKLHKNINESQQDTPHEHLQTSVNLKEQSLPFNKREEPTSEQLEKSDLTEEHGLPIDSHKPSYSSDSTQNSNKRKRDDPVIPDDSNHVKPIKIRLFKKQKGPDSIKETACSVSEISGQQNHSSQDARLNGISIPLLPSTSNSVNGQRTTFVSSNRKTGIHETSTSHDRKQQIPSSGRQVLPVSLHSKKSDVAVLHSSRQQPQQQPIPSYRRPLEHEIPIPSSIPVPAPSVSRKNEAAMVSSLGRMSTDEKKKDPISEIPSKVGPTRYEKKMMKKHLKYEKLIGGWVPPVLETQAAAPDGDDDWLMGSGKVRTARSASSRDDMETCREMTWQPCARFLVEADVHALPYTVPF